MLLFQELGFGLTDVIGGWLNKSGLTLGAWLLYLWLLQKAGVFYCLLKGGFKAFEINAGNEKG